MRVARRRTNARSWLTNSSAPSKSTIMSSSQVIASISRWFVGSSSKQQIGRRHQRPAQHHAAPPAARQGAQRRVAVQLQPRDDLLHLQVGLPFAVRAAGCGALFDYRAHGLLAGGGGFLLEARHRGARAYPHVAAVGSDPARNDVQQGGFAFAVAAQQTNALALADLQGDVVQQGLEAKA